MTPRSTSRVDLHCHPTAAAVSKLGVKRALGPPECATPPCRAPSRSAGAPPRGADLSRADRVGRGGARRQPSGGDHSPIEVIAHRGASAYALENSFAACDLALAQGADAIELDIRATADGCLVVLHDSRLLRTAGDPRAIAGLRADELMAIDSAVRPPTLDAVLERHGRATRWLLELKDPTPAAERALAAALTAHGLERTAVVQSFDAAALRRLRSTAPALVVAPLYRLAPSPRRLRAAATFAAAVGVRHGAVDVTLMLRARACGLGVRAWTANAPRDIERLAGLGVDGVITDVPDVARAVVDAGDAAAEAA